MTRPWIATIVLLLVAPARLSAQSAEFRVDTASASVHKAPSIASPVIGHARQGVALEVTRDLGSWVKVPWPDASDGIGYIHVSTGTRTGAILPRAGAPAVHAGEVAAASQPLALAARYVVPPAHIVGLGGQFGGSSVGSGINARTWFHDRLGLQLEIARTSLTGPNATDRLTTTQFAPSLLYSPSNLMTDYVWVRPYLGAGPRFVRQSLGVIPRGRRGGVKEQRRRADLRRRRVHLCGHAAIFGERGPPLWLDRRTRLLPLTSMGWASRSPRIGT